MEKSMLEQIGGSYVRQDDYVIACPIGIKSD